jgi:hypothetical protein
MFNVRFQTGTFPSQSIQPARVTPNGRQSYFCILEIVRRKDILFPDQTSPIFGISLSERFSTLIRPIVVDKNDSRSQEQNKMDCCGFMSSVYPLYSPSESPDTAFSVLL